tara:strand:- start:1890 stop:2096 length:207 start_codon:yes stop_codon:yes gene_type:complete
MKKILITFVFFYSILSTNAFAYLDPGTGSIILQAILGAIAAGFSYCVFYWNKVKNFFKKIFKKKEKTE